MHMIGVHHDTRGADSAGPEPRRGFGPAVTLCVALACLTLVIVPHAHSLRSVAAQTEDDASINTEPTLFDVQIEGNVTIPADAIARHVKTRPGRPASAQQIREDVAALFRTKWFLNVEPVYRNTDEGTVLVFKVVEKPVVQRVEYKGVDPDRWIGIKVKHLEALTGVKVGSPYDVNTNREMARRIEEHYHEKGYAFTKVTLERGEDPDDREVVFNIEEGPKVHVVWTKFEGNTGWRTDDVLRGEIATRRAILWTFGGLWDPAILPDDLAALKDYYTSVGYFDVKVEHRLEFNEDKSKLTIVYIVDEGVPYVVRNIEIIGNDVLKQEDLLDEQKMKVGEIFNARHLNKDVSRMEEKYGELGRMFAKVEPVTRFLEKPGEVDITYKIDEDMVRRIRRVNVTIEGDHPHTRRGVVLNRVLTQPGDLADPKKIALSKTRLAGSAVFERVGPAAPRVDITEVETKFADEDVLRQVRGQNPDRAAAPRRATPKAAAVPAVLAPEVAKPAAPQLRVRPANVGPLNAVDPPEADALAEEAWEPSASWKPTAEPERYLRDPILPIFSDGADIAFHEKDPAATDAIIRGQSPDPFTQPPGNPFYAPDPQGDPMPEGQVDLEYSVTEARTGRLMFGVGVNSDAGVVGSVVLDEQNFDIFRPPTSWRDVMNGTAWRGGGQRFRMELVPGSVVSRYMVSWTEPYFLDTNNSLSLSGYFYNRFFPDWTERRGGGKVGVGRILTPFLTINTQLRLEEVVISDPDFPTPPILAEAVGSNFLSTGQISLTHDTRDSAMLPSEGHRIMAAYEQAFGDFQYPRFEIEGSQYFTVWSRPDGNGKHIVIASAEVGWTGDDTPIFERFFAGGFQTFRGFDFRGVSPEQFGVKVGGEFMFLTTLEYMFPLLANDMLYGVVFTDAGTVEASAGFDEFRVAVGAGLRVSIPAMGPAPLAFDFAVPVMSEDFDDERLFTFSVGVTY